MKDDFRGIGVLNCGFGPKITGWREMDRAFRMSFIVRRPYNARRWPRRCWRG